MTSTQRGRTLRISAAILLASGVASAATKTVDVGPGGALMFSPSTVSIHVGDTVKWVWMSGPHTTTRTQGAETWDSGIASAPNTFEHTFTQAGTFPYVCTIHQALGMTGAVVVQNASGATTTTVRTASTTSTSSLGAVPLSCDSVADCRAALTAALPAPDAATPGRDRTTARVLQRLDKRAGHKLDRVATTTGSRQKHVFNDAKSTLEHLRTAAEKAAAEGTLGVPVGPIDAAVTSLLTVAQP